MNTATSNSKVNDFRKSKEYYYKRHISRELEFKTTPAIKMGKIVDAFVSGLPSPYQPKVLRRDDPSLFEFQKTLPDEDFVSPAQYTEGWERAQAIIREPFYQWYMQHDAKFQHILQTKLAVTVAGKKTDVDICGMVDVMTLDGDTLYIDDFKSVASAKVKSPLHWYYNAKSMGYFRQMAAYRYMAYETLQKEMNFKNIVCRHVVVTKEMDGLYRVHLYILDGADLDAGLGEFLTGVQDIASEKDWIDAPITWDNAIHLTRNEIMGVRDEATFVSDDEDV